jgi:SAM-dependent methyltransferase
MGFDPWLERWLSLIHKYADTAPILELGCGQGDDTVTLVQTGYNVVAIDISESLLFEARKRVSTAKFYQQDLREPFPMSSSSVSLVIASLSLHYFSWNETVLLVQQIHNIIKPFGVVLCRLNSTNDFNFGATGHQRIDKNYYLVDGVTKRFFDYDSIIHLFANEWVILSIEERISYKYEQPKVLWEVILQSKKIQSNTIS